MKTKTILSMAIIAVLPMVAHAQNISGAMYTAPSAANNDHPAPTTNGWAPYGRIDIDTADQEHIATTAYVKGAYNSAIAAVNKVDSDKQEKLSMDGVAISSNVIGNDMKQVAQGVDFSELGTNDAIFTNPELDYMLVTSSGVISTVGVAAGQMSDKIDSQRVTIYTTWDDDSANATTQVALSTAQ